ncbi:MAG: hypothetical protein AAFR21_13880 [Pseudomonadota bacterium]
MLKKLILIVALIWAGPALAGDKALTTADAKKFTASLPAATELGEGFKEKGVDLFNSTEPKLAADGTFKPYSTLLLEMKDAHPAEYRQVNAMAKSAKFSNAVEWASVGDRVMLAYIADKMPPNAGAMMSAMTPEMMAMMPPETRAKLETSKAVMSAVDNVPQADKDALEPVMADLDAALMAAGQSAGAFDPMSSMQQ